MSNHICKPNGFFSTKYQSTLLVSQQKMFVDVLKLSLQTWICFYLSFLQHYALNFVSDIWSVKS